MTFQISKIKCTKVVQILLAPNNVNEISFMYFDEF